MAHGTLDTTPAPGTSSGKNGGASGPPQGQSQTDKGAKATLQATLSRYGLAGLADWAWDKYLNGENVNQIMLDLRQTDAYKTRFPAMAYLSKHGMAVSEAQYIDLERSYKEQFHQYGIPTGFFDNPSDFAKLIEGNVSSSELGSRLALRAQAVLGASAEDRARLAKYGWDLGHMVAFVTNPKVALPKLEQQFLAAQIGGASDRAGMSATGGEALQLAREGVTADQAGQGFGQLAQEQDLFTPLVGTSETGIGRGTQLAAEFEQNGQAQRQIQQRAAARKAQFAGQSGFASSQAGFTGVGSAQGA